MVLFRKNVSYAETVYALCAILFSSSSGHLCFIDNLLREFKIADPTPAQRKEALFFGLFCIWVGLVNHSRCSQEIINSLMSDTIEYCSKALEITSKQQIEDILAFAPIRLSQYAKIYTSFSEGNLVLNLQKELHINLMGKIPEEFLQLMDECIVATLRLASVKKIVKGLFEKFKIDVEKRG